MEGAAEPLIAFIGFSGSDASISVVVLATKTKRLPAELPKEGAEVYKFTTAVADALALSNKTGVGVVGAPPVSAALRFNQVQVSDVAVVDCTYMFALTTRTVLVALPEIQNISVGVAYETKPDAATV